MSLTQNAEGTLVPDHIASQVVTPEGNRDGEAHFSPIGWHLVKMELRVMVEELLPRIVSVELTGERKVLQTNFGGGLKNRPLRLELS